MLAGGGGSAAAWLTALLIGGVAVAVVARRLLPSSSGSPSCQWPSELAQLVCDLWPPRVQFPEDQLLPPAESRCATAAAVGGGGPTGADGQEGQQRSLLFTPLRLRGLTLRNRVVKAATFEAGCDEHGAPKPCLVDHHREVAAGGTALTVVAYGSVSRDGRSFATQLLLSEAARPGLTALTAAVHAESGAAALQLTHAGSFAKPHLSGTAAGGPQLAPSRIFNPAGFNWARAMDRADMDRVVADFAAAALLALECGFDALEIHLGHGYLLSQFLSPFSNRREDEYGGTSLANRMRFPLEVLRAVRAAASMHSKGGGGGGGGGAPILVKFNLGDGFTGGQSLSDAIALAAVLHAEGVADLLVPSGGWVTRNGLFMLRGGVPLVEMVDAQVRPSVIPIYLFTYLSICDVSVIVHWMLVVTSVHCCGVHGSRWQRCAGRYASSVGHMSPKSRGSPTSSKRLHAHYWRRCHRRRTCVCWVA